MCVYRKCGQLQDVWVSYLRRTQEPVHLPPHLLPPWLFLRIGDGLYVQKPGTLAATFHPPNHRTHNNSNNPPHLNHPPFPTNTPVPREKRSLIKSRTHMSYHKPRIPTTSRIPDLGRVPRLAYKIYAWAQFHQRPQSNKTAFSAVSWAGFSALK